MIPTTPAGHARSASTPVSRAQTAIGPWTTSRDFSLPWSSVSSSRPTARGSGKAATRRRFGSTLRRRWTSSRLSWSPMCAATLTSQRMFIPSPECTWRCDMAEVLALHEPDAHEPPKLLFADDESLRVLIPGADSLRADPVFGDDCWELAGHPSWGGKVGRQTSLDF